MNHFFLKKCVLHKSGLGETFFPKLGFTLFCAEKVRFATNLTVSCLEMRFALSLG